MNTQLKWISSWDTLFSSSKRWLIISLCGLFHNCNGIHKIFYVNSTVFSFIFFNNNTKYILAFSCIDLHFYSFHTFGASSTQKYIVHNSILWRMNCVSVSFVVNSPFLYCWDFFFILVFSKELFSFVAWETQRNFLSFCLNKWNRSEKKGLIPYDFCADTINCSVNCYWR